MNDWYPSDLTPPQYNDRSEVYDRFEAIYQEKFLTHNPYIS